MTRDDIIRMFEKANGWSPKGFENTLEDLERFAALIAAHEREACAKLCEEGGRDESGRIHVQAWGCAKAIRARGQE